MSDFGNIQDLVRRAENIVAGIEGPAEREAALKRVLASLLVGSSADASAARAAWSPDDLRKLALEHTVMMWSIAVSVLLGAIQALALRGPSSALTLSWFVIGIACSVLLFSISKRLYGATVAIALALITLVPLVGYVVLLVVDRKAMHILRSNGFVIGLIRARPRTAIADA